MKLRTKLLLGVGILLCAMAVILSIVPTFFIRKDVSGATEDIRQLLIRDHQQLILSQQVWLEGVLESNKQNNDATLFMLYDDFDLSSPLTFQPHSPNTSVWEELAHIVGLDPGFGFAQAHNPTLGKSAVVSPHTTTLYPIEKMSPLGEWALISVPPDVPGQESRVFLGYLLPSKLQQDKGHQLYALIDPSKATQQLSEVSAEIAKLTPERVHKQLADVQYLPTPGDQANEAYLWAVKIDMIRELTPLFAEGLAFTPQGKSVAPEGLARLDKTGNGYAILTQQVFSTEPLFDDALYFKQHLPGPDASPVATGMALITVSEGNHAYSGNTLLLGDTYLTIGTPLSLLAKQLSLSSHSMILMEVNRAFWLGYDKLGNKLPTEKIEQILKAGIVANQSGTLTLDGTPYYFAPIGSLENGNLAFYNFHTLVEEHAIINTLREMETKLSERISMQLLLISLATIILVLLFIARIGLTFISPIAKLARATHAVAEGHYGEAVLPVMEKGRNDEIATLTQAFAEMIEGLEERENIRAVLDKVVSKEVATEILRTQLHLGGEERVVSVLFGDIRGFTQLSAEFPPQKTIQMLNECMTKVSSVIEGEGGVIDKYVGDEVMAIFGAPAAIEEHALRAISSGVLIIQSLKKWNLERVMAGEPVVEMGIGVHSGLVVAGNMGAEDRLNYTVVGAQVNLAARLCEAAQGGQLIISADTFAQPGIAEAFYTKPLPPLALKGISAPVQVYEVLGFKWEEGDMGDRSGK